MSLLPRAPHLRVNGLLLFAGLLLLLTGLAACSPYQISDRSVQFNDSLQDLDNRQVLLNAVRASKRYPPYFTSVNQLQSSGELDGSQVNFTLPFGPQNHNIYSATPSIKVQTGITVQTNPLDTQEFYQGYMTPVKTDLIGYYLDYGWPRQLILHAFLHEIDLPTDIVEGIKYATLSNITDGGCARLGKFAVGDGPEMARSCLDNLSDTRPVGDALKYSTGSGRILPECSVFTNLNKLPASDIDTVAKAGNTVLRFINDPTNRCRLAAFQLLVAMLDKLELAVVAVPPPATSGGKPITVPTTDKNISIKVQNDAPAAGGKVNFALNKVPNPCVAVKRQQTQPRQRSLHTETRAARGQATTAAPPVNALGMSPDAKVQNPAPLPTKNEPLPPLVPSPPPGGSPTLATTWQATLCNDEGLISVVPRSPEAIVFYLGQLINVEYPRPGEDPPLIALVRAEHSSLPLFDVRKGLPTEGETAEVSVTVDGESYTIPRTEKYNSTMHTLTLVEQVIALQKKGTQIPGIVPVQVINP